MPSTEDFIAAGLYDPHSPGAAGRLELLHWLLEQGFTLDEIATGDRTMSLAAMAGDRQLLGGRRLDRDAAIARTDLDPEVFDRISSAIGFVPLDELAVAAEGPHWSESEVEAIATMATLGEMFSVEEATGLMRVIGAALARVGDAAVSMFLNDIESRLLVDGSSELDLAQTVDEATRLLDGLGAQLDPVLRRHVLQSIQRNRRATVDFTERFSYRYAVGFVDLVGFTEVSSTYEATTLARFLREFEGRAHDVVTAEGARVVKLIGDEVMFAATDPVAACRAASALMAGFGSEDERIVPRGGLAFGEVLVRGGDYYGAVVNLASRLVDLAVPQEVLVTDAVARAAPACRFEPAGRRMVKGFSEPVGVWSLGGR